MFRGQTVFEGEVELFELKGYPKAKRAYAWGYPNPSDETKLEVTAVLEAPPIKTAVDAVRAAVVNERSRKK
jgi:hypothetical protein